jgi:hypothetical protein
MLGDRIKGTKCITPGLSSFEVYTSTSSHYPARSTVFFKTLKLNGALGQSLAFYGNWSFITVVIK